MTIVTRFAPSPTGDLHLGHAYAALFAYDAARRGGGRYLVRIEDIDAARCRPAFETRNLDDLAWLGLAPDAPPVRQSQRLHHYRAAIEQLVGLGVTYPCLCTRTTIRAEIAAAAGAPQTPMVREPAPQNVYPGTCRRLDAGLVRERLARGEPYALRLDAERATRVAGTLTWTDRVHGEAPVRLDHLGDVVIARKALATSYHLAVVVDDAAQGVTLVTRGEDLLSVTPLHRLLYALLRLEPPLWHHHPLCRDGAGRRLAKRSGALSIRALRERGLGPAAVLAMAERATG
ncbi:MAG: tRNA glutamyl-Q(34) synthetase GluQRS, partial [Rhodospirillales bacterium]|nr:tRNA glutamyl-Q(34) synthetase GluQRS [Rhodospirillales bacterium]